MAARYASSATVIVPHAYLDDAVHSVPRLATLDRRSRHRAAARELRRSRPTARRAEPDGPFLAADVTLADEKNHAAFSRKTA